MIALIQEAFQSLQKFSILACYITIVLQCQSGISHRTLFAIIPPVIFCYSISLNQYYCMVKKNFPGKNLVNGFQLAKSLPIISDDHTHN